MPKFPGFIGPAFAARAAAADYERLVNLYVEQNGPNAPDQWVLYSTPGLAQFATLPTSPVRGTWVGENRLFVASGDHWYEVFADGTYNDRGQIANDGKPVQIFPNGNQLMIVSGGHVYIDTGSNGLFSPVYTILQGLVFSDGSGNLTLTYQYEADGVFTSDLVGSYIMLTIGGTPAAYQITAYTDPTHITAAGAPAGSNIFFTIADSGTAATTLIGAPPGVTLVASLTGDTFDYALIGQPININGSTYTVQAVYNPQIIGVAGTALGNNASVQWYASVPVVASCGAFLDGYFIVALPGTRQFNISALNDGTRWNALDYALKEAYPDAIVMMVADHEELYLFGSQTAEVWRNTGNPDFPFERDQGAFIHVGLFAPWSMERCTVTQTIKFLGGDAEGQPVAYESKGYQPRRISTHALEYRWRNYTTASDAEAFVYVEEGHEFWVINFPTANETWVYDSVASVWHQWAFGSDPNALSRSRARAYAFVFNHHIVGDYQTGTLYYLSSEYADDAGTPILGIRRAPHLNTELKRTFYSQFLLALSGTYSSLTLSWSDDYGTNWSTPRAPNGARVARGYSTRPLAQRWSRLGSAQDRIFEVVFTRTGKMAITAADLEFEQGS